MTDNNRCGYVHTHSAQRHTTVTAYLESKLLLLFAFDLQSVCQYSMAEENPAAQRQTTVAAHLESELLMLFAFLVIHTQTTVTVYLESSL